MVDPDADPVTTGVLHSSIGYLQWSLGQGEAALASHELAVALVPSEPPSAERAKVLGGLAGALMGEGRWAPSRVVGEAAVECAVAAGATVEESRARNILGSDLVALGHSDAGIEQLRQACRLAAASGRVDMLIVGHHNLALNLAASDQLEASLEEARTGLAVARDAGVERRFGQDLAALAGDALTRLGTARRGGRGDGPRAGPRSGRARHGLPVDRVGAARRHPGQRRGGRPPPRRDRPARPGPGRRGVRGGGRGGVAAPRRRCRRARWPRWRRASPRSRGSTT